jgi:hypothetical protein
MLFLCFVSFGIAKWTRQIVSCLAERVDASTTNALPATGEILFRAQTLQLLICNGKIVLVRTI